MKRRPEANAYDPECTDYLKTYYDNYIMKGAKTSPPQVFLDLAPKKFILMSRCEDVSLYPGEYTSNPTTLTATVTPRDARAAPG